MRINKNYILVFIKTLVVKLFSLLLWLLLAFAIRSIFISSARNWTQADLMMSMVELFIGLAPAYLIWASLFTLVRYTALNQKPITFYAVLSFTLVLNFAEHLFLFSDFSRIINVSKHYGWFNVKTWATLPDFPEILSLIIASIVFAILYYRFVEKKSASTSG